MPPNELSGASDIGPIGSTSLTAADPLDTDQRSDRRWLLVVRASVVGFGMSVMAQPMHVLSPLIPIAGPFLIGFMAAGRARVSPTEGIWVGLGIGALHALTAGILVLGALAVASRLYPPPPINMGLIALIVAVLLTYGTILSTVGGFMGARAESRAAAVRT
jgi:hypothetical protein